MNPFHALSRLSRGLHAHRHHPKRHGHHPGHNPGHPGHHLGRHGPHGHGRGFGGEAGMPGGPGSRLGGFERGRKLGSDDLQLLILDLLARQPSHGYELIKEIDQRSRGYYVPSPGMVYPALSYLEEVDYASVEVQGAKKRYSITAAGQAHLQAHRDAVEATWAQLARFGERMTRLREDEAIGDPDDRGAENADELHAVIDSLRSLLRERRRAAPDERRRIAAILADTVAAIRQGGRP